MTTEPGWRTVISADRNFLDSAASWLDTYGYLVESGYGVLYTDADARSLATLLGPDGLAADPGAYAIGAGTPPCQSCGRPLVRYPGWRPTRWTPRGLHIACGASPGLPADMLGLLERFPRLTVARLARDLGMPDRVARVYVRVALSGRTNARRAARARYDANLDNLPEGDG